MRPSLAGSCLAALLAACGPLAAEPGPGGGPPGEGRSDGSSRGGGEGGSSREVAVVTRVVDGDTFRARLGGEILDVRLIGIDAPELRHPTNPIECYGPEAAAFAERRLGGRRLSLEYDVERIDPYGRTLAYAWIGRRLVNEDIVRNGYATLATIPPNVSHVERLVEAERKARRDGLGLWTACLGDRVDIGAEWRNLHG